MAEPLITNSTTTASASDTTTTTTATPAEEDDPLVKDILGTQTTDSTYSKPETMATPVGEMRLTGEAKVLWDALMTARILTDSTFDSDVREKLSSLEEAQALDALERYRDANSKEIRNTSRYMMSIINRVIAAFERSGEAYKDVVLDPEVVTAIDELIKEKKIEDGEFKAKATAALKAFPAKRSLEMLTKFRDVEHMRIANPVGFLMGIIKRFRTYENEADSGSFEKVFARLSPQIQAMFSAKFAEGALESTQLSHKCMEQLAALPPQEGEDAASRLLNTDLTTVRNLTGFFIGILRRYYQQEQRDDGYGGFRGGRGGGRGGYGGRGRGGYHAGGGDYYGAGGRDRDYGSSYAPHGGYEGGYRAPYDSRHRSPPADRRSYSGGAAYGAQPSYASRSSATTLPYPATGAAPAPAYPVYNQNKPAAAPSSYRAPAPASYPSTYPPSTGYGR